MKISTIAIVGAGALGILYGDFFTRALGRENVGFVVNRDRLERYGKHGFTFNGKPCGFRYIPAKKAEPVDLVIFATKNTALESAIADAAGCIGRDTVILSVLNGVTSEQVLEERFGKRNVVYCVAQGMDATKSGYALTCGHIGQIRYGIPADQPEKQAALEALTELFAETGLPCVLEKDIMHRLWSKLMLNVGVNQVVMVFEGTYGTVQKPGAAREMMVAAMREVMQLAPYAGVTLTENDLTGYVDLMDTLDPAGMPSMRQDGLAHRRSEVELFAGTVCRLGDQYGVNVPVNRRLLAIVREMEAEY